MITTSINYSSLDAKSFKNLYTDKKGTLIDVRTPAEYAEDHISGSINLDFYSVDFENQLETLDKEHSYFIYCRTGSKTSTVMQIMKEKGFKEVYDLKGGIIAWEVSI